MKCIQWVVIVSLILSGELVLAKESQKMLGSFEVQLNIKDQQVKVQAKTPDRKSEPNTRLMPKPPLVAMAEQMTMQLERRFSQLDPSERAEIRSKISDISNLLTGRRGLQVQGVQYVAECYLDNDTSFDWNEELFGELTGSLEEVIDECQNMAKFSYGVFGSSGIKIKELLGGRGYGLKKATCHVDDDTSFDWNVFVIGELYAETYEDLRNDCDKIAKSIYGVFGSSGLKNLAN